MINYSTTDPRIFPIGGTGADCQIDRVQAIDPTATLNREAKKELGTDGTLGYIKKSPTIAYRMTQLENGNFSLFRKLANADDADTTLDLNDFKTSYMDVACYLLDDDNVFRGTIQYPSLRLAGFSLGIGDPQADITRTFDLIGESAITWKANNKYFIAKNVTVPTGTAGDYVITVSDPTPVEDPDDAVFMLRVVRIRSGVVSELVSGTGFTYVDGTHALTIKNALAGDLVKYYYTASSYIAGQDTFTTNLSDAVGLSGECASLFIGVGEYLYKVQDVNIDVRFDRADYREVGNKNIVLRGVRSKTVSVAIGRFVDDWTVEEALRGQSANYGKIDIAKLSSDVTFYLKVYSDNTKSTFKWGIKCTKMSPTEERPSFSTDEYLRKAVTLEGEAMVLSTNEADIL